MPQKSRREKDRAAQRRESGQFKYPVAPAPIEMPRPEAEIRVSTNLPGTLTRRATNAAAMPVNAEPTFDYSYVYADLRRIGLLALVCIAAMVALAFVFHP
jgi:hypothetical protein